MVLIRQLRRIPAGADGKQRRHRSRPAGAPGLLAERLWCLHQGPQSESAMLQYMSYWPQPNGPELLSNGVPSGTAYSYNSPKQYIREDFGTLRTDYILGDRDSLSGAYTIDDGNSLVPLADPCLLLTPRSGCKWPACRKRIFSRRNPQYLSRWFFARGVRS